MAAKRRYCILASRNVESSTLNPKPFRSRICREKMSYHSIRPASKQQVATLPRGRGLGVVESMR